MSATAASQFPNPLYWIEIRTIGWQKIEPETTIATFTVFLVQLSMMVASIVRNDDHGFSGMTARLSELLEKFHKSFRVEFFWLPTINKFSISKANCSKITNLVACRFMLYHRIFFFGSNPHAATRAVLLEVNFIDGPQINFRVGYNALKFFLCSSCFSRSAFAIMGRGFLSRKPS